MVLFTDCVVIYQLAVFGFLLVTTLTTASDEFHANSIEERGADKKPWPMGKGQWGEGFFCLDFLLPFVSRQKK